MKIVEVVEKKRSEILRTVFQYGGKNVRLFGSVARGVATASSDLDILLEMEKGRSLLDLVAIQQDLEDLLGRPVHVVTESSLSPYFRDEVLKEAVSL